jgi:hypothetical protein
MKRSDQRILTTHTGSLPRPSDLVEALNAKELGKGYDARALRARVSRAVTEIVQRQADTGLDVINDGEHSKVSWMAYARERLSGLEDSRRDAGLFGVCGGLPGHAGDAGRPLFGDCPQAHGPAQGVDMQRPDRLCRRG